MAERQTSAPLFANSVRLLPADHESTLVIARQTFAKIGQAWADAAPSLGGAATTDAVAPAGRQLKWAGVPVGRRSARGRHCGRSKMGGECGRAGCSAIHALRASPDRAGRWWTWPDDLLRPAIPIRPRRGERRGRQTSGEVSPRNGGLWGGRSEEPTEPSTGLTCIPSRTREENPHFGFSLLSGKLTGLLHESAVSTQRRIAKVLVPQAFLEKFLYQANREAVTFLLRGSRAFKMRPSTEAIVISSFRCFAAHSE